MKQIILRFFTCLFIGMLCISTANATRSMSIPYIDTYNSLYADASTDATGLTDLGQNGYYHKDWEEYAYSFQGSETTFVEGATIKIEGSATSLDCWLNDNGAGEKWKYNKFSFELTAEDVTKLEQTNYTFWMAAWYGNITKVTITLPNGTVVGEGGNTGGGTTTDPEEDETDTTPYEKDRTNAFGYAFTNAQLKNYPQLTDVPTVYLNVYAPDSYETGTYANNDIKTGTPQTLAAKYQLAANSKITEKKYNWYYQTQIIVRDDNGKMKERNELTTVRARGNSTWRWSDKKPLRLKFPSKTRFLATSADDKTSTNAKSWTLLANSFDKSMLRNGLTHELVDYINKVDNANNLPFNPACQYVDLVVNGEYWGTYQISDQVQVGPGRVDVDADNGWFVEYTVNNNGFVEEPFLKIGSSYVNIKNPEDPNVVDGDPNSTTQLADNQATTNPIYNELKTMLNNLNTGIKGIVVAEKYASSDWMQYIDTRSLVDWFIAMDVTGNFDGCIANDYLYKDVTDKKLKVGPLWDLDLGFGNKQEAKNHFYTAQGQGITYSIQAMLKDPYFVKKLYERWQQIYNNGALTTYLNDKVTALSSTLAQTQAKNYEKWSLGTSNLGKTYSTYQAAVNDVVAFNNAHIPWLETEYKSLYDSMGCADLEDIVDEPEEETGGEEGGEDTSGIPETSTFTQNNVEDTGYLIPANAFNPNATKIQVTLTRSNGTATRAWGFYGFNGSEYVNNINGSDWTTYTINVTEATDIDAVSKNGLKWRLQCESGTIGDVTIVVKNILNNTPGTTPDTPTETFEQLTDLPTMYLQIYKLNEDGTSDKTKTETITTSGGAYHTARIVIVDEHNTIKERDEETEIRGRGNTTWSGDKLKNPYRLKFPTKTKLLSYLDEDGVTVINNYANAKSWTLLANKGDYSLIRNALTAELGKYMNMPFVPAYKFVDLVINGSYAGTYQISDQIQVAKDRVNVNSDTGWLLSANRGSTSYEEDPYFTAGGATFNIKNPEATVATASGVTTDPKYDAMKAWMTEAMNNASKSEIANYFDMESLANYLIGIDITGDPDGAVDNFYMYREDDSSSKMKFGPMWDYDLAYGNVSGRDRKEKHFFDGDGDYGWISKVKQMYNTPTVIKAIWKRWKEVYGEYDSEARQSTLTKYLLAKVNELDAIIAQSQAKNFEAGKAGEVAGSKTYSTHAEAIAALKAWIPDHIEWLNSAYKADYKTITGLDPDNCTHTYTKNEYASNGDGTYSRKCDICGMAEEGGTKVYKYITYNEDGTLNETFSESKTWATDNAPANPNAIVVVEYGSDITGKNIVVKKNDKYTCANFELTDGHSFYSPIKFTAVTATYTRNVSNDWGTICLPYKVQTVEANDATYYQLKNVGKDNSTLVFEVATSSGAYTPLVFKRKSGSSITVNATEVTVKPTTEDKTNSTVADWTLIGTMEQKKFTNVASELATGEQLYYIAQNKFWHTTSSYTNNPFRAYFIYKPTNPSNAAKSFSIGVADDTATDIAGISNDALAIFVDNGSITMSSGKNTAVRIYTTSGTLVANTSVGAGESKTINLPTGLYIINGTKVTVK